MDILRILFSFRFQFNLLIQFTKIPQKTHKYLFHSDVVQIIYLSSKLSKDKEME